ncbi:MAG TPA: sugar phosphate isomerase/epimerase [Capsulimonadaceae bacterium]|jgi:sugar phosphate isomerase/epimerase
MIPISVQLYSLRDLAAQDFPAVLRALAETGFAGVEFAGFHGNDPATLAKLVASLGLKCSSAHVGLATKETVGELVDTYGLFGCKVLVSGFGPDQFKTLDDVKESAAKFQTAAELLKAQGLEFAIHNHNWEFNALPDGQVPYDVMLAEAPDAGSELDIYWAKVGGHEPADVIKKHSARLPLLHVKDGTVGEGRKFTACGDGVVNIPAAIAAADPAVTKWATVEIDSIEGDMLAAIQKSYRYLVGNGLAAGTK